MAHGFSLGRDYGQVNGVIMLKEFNKRFGIQSSVEEEKRRFVQRINQSVFYKIEKRSDYELLFKSTCYWLGVNADDCITIANRGNYGEIIMPSLRSLTSDDFLKTIKILVLSHGFLKFDSELQEKMSFWIENALSHSTVDLGVKWKNGMFYPSGAEILDETLVEDPLDWLDDFPDEKQDFLKAIDRYSTNKLDDVVINCYLVVEGLVRKVLQNNRTLDNNREELLRKVGLSQEWKAFLSNYINYANEFKRHASDRRHTISPSEVEAFLYFTGLLVRLIVESKK
ncbi:MAG: hypothetical protein ACE5IC_02475 [Candidatus Brocadiales bacterium]